MYDYCIIGAGIIGTAIARELSKYDCKVLVLERESDIANEQTAANSAIIHAGHDPIPGTLKARFCVEGNQIYEEWENELSIPLLKSGAFLVARSDKDIEHLNIIYDRAIRNGVYKPHILSGDDARNIEPNLSKDIIKVLSLPSTKVTYPWEVAFALMENAIKNGVELKLNSEVTNISKQSDCYEIEINGSDIIETKGVINACGVFTDVIASFVEKNVPYKIQPRKGEYIVLDKIVKGFINHVLYPIPNEMGKGTLIVPQYHGNILLGPTSTNIEEKDDLTNTIQDMNSIKTNVKYLAENIPFDKTIRTFAGIRATSDYDDFYINESIECDNFYHLGGIDSPGLTSAPAIAKYLVQMIIDKKGFKAKKNFNPYRYHKEYFSKLSEKEQKKLISENPKYGVLVCKCEKITEAEIVEAINGPLGTDSVKGIKKRARAGSGLCQGGYCEPLILKIIAREKGLKLNEVNYYNPNTQILLEETKGGKK